MIQLVTVVPIKKTGMTGELTYFSSLPVAIGDIVTVPFRTKSLEALVLHVQSASEEKASIKKSGIGYRKVIKIIPHRPLLGSCIRAAMQSAEYFVAPLGSVLASITPAIIWTQTRYNAPEITPSKIPETSILLADDEERFVQYRSLIRETFRRNESVLIVAPTIQDAETTFKTLSRGIESYAVLLHSAQKTKVLNSAIEKIGTETHPLLVVATPGFLSVFPRHASTIVLERENSPSYKQLSKPFLDFRYVVRKLVKEAGLRLILGDTLLSTEAVHKYEERTYEELTSPKWRMSSKSSAGLVDMRPYKPDLKGRLRVISDELRTLISETKSASDSLFVFAGRKGIAPTTLCGDCGSILLCDICNHPVVLHSSSEQKRFYLCHRCGKRTDAQTRCKKCTSWRLFAFGTGTEIVEEALSTLPEKPTVIRLDGESAKDRKEALALAQRFYQSPGSILIGTELALPYLDKPLGAVAVASIDELFSVPDFRINERVMYLLLKLRQLSERRFLIQTRNPDHDVIKSALEGNLSGFYRNELDIRKALSYPPFSVILKITLSGDPKHLQKEMAGLSARFPYPLHVFPTLVRKSATISRLSGLAKIPKDKWPDKDILELLNLLPPSTEINVSPENFS